MTAFGIYLVILGVIGIAANLYYAGQGGMHHSPGVLLFAAFWATLNVLGIIFWGTGLGV
jgi:hypothetical protein